MNVLYSYNPNRFRSLDTEDVTRWLKLYSMINTNVSFIDRTGGIKIPLKTAIPPQLLMPQYDRSFSMTYEECCQLMVRSLIDRQSKLDIPIRLLYSGGIDSSLILASFIKELGQSKAERAIQLVMSIDSIEENPWMWDKIIRRGRFDILHGENHAGDWGTDRILVGGEFNDQLMGSDIYKDLVRWKGDQILMQPWSEAIMTEYHLYKGLSVDDAELWTQLFSEHLRRAPCSIETVADWWWWVNFSCKWGAVYFRILMHANGKISQEYLDTYYCQFYGSDEFQKWSMLDRVHKHQGSWTSYKWHAKELVCDLLGDRGFMSKMKRGSLWTLLSYRRGAEVIDYSYRYHHDIDPHKWYEPTNSFNKIKIKSEIINMSRPTVKKRRLWPASGRQSGSDPEGNGSTGRVDRLLDFFDHEKFPMIGSISNKDGKVLQVYQSNSLAFCPATALFLKVSSELYEKKLGNPYFVVGYSARVIWAQDQTEVVGGIVYEYVKESMAGNMILGFVSEPYRGKGIFGELQAIFEDEIRKLGGVRIYSQVHSLSNSQIRSMEKSGMDLYYYRMTRWIDDSLA